MFYVMIIIFVLGYTAIALEHPIKIDKAASALLTAVLIWTVLIIGCNQLLVGSEEPLKVVEEGLMHHLGDISGILFFLLGAMAIVELVDVHGGFELITKNITTNKKRKLLWILSILTFFMSAALDNLTTSIIMAALLRKLLKEKEDLWLFSGVIILAANAGGAWSPIGDVTTIMLWIGGQVTAQNIIVKLLLPSIMCLIVPLIFISFRVKGELASVIENKENDAPPLGEKNRYVFRNRVIIVCPYI